MESAKKYFNEGDLKQYASVTEELKRIQQIYNLILEGATDYIYQLDVAMLSAPKNSKGTVSFYLDSTSKFISRRYQLENELRKSVENKFEGFRLVYQPIIDCDTQRWVARRCCAMFRLRWAPLPSQRSSRCWNIPR